MNGIRKLLKTLENVKPLKPFKTIFQTLDGIIFGTTETTRIAPHFLDNIEIKRYMTCVILALIPATVASIVFFGIKVLWLIFFSYAAGGIVEVAFAIIRKKDIEEGFLVTGLIFPLILPPTTPIWIAVVGIVFGTLFGKEVYGGTGRNIFNPALVGRLFITIAFPGVMSSSWQVPFTDIITSATPLSIFKTTQVITPNADLLLGLSAGSMGELFRIGIIAGGIFLIFTKVSNWRIPITYLGTVAILSFFGNIFMKDIIAPPLFQLLSGGLLFGAMFMATDPVTSPFSKAGKIIFAFMCGLLTLLIRSFSVYTEGVMFSILIMNALSPLIDQIIISIKYRAKKI